ncbi:hypothetical protein V8V80_12905 [Niallia taxi]
MKKVVLYVYPMGKVVFILKKDYIVLTISLVIIISSVYFFQQNQIAKESITYFPIDTSVSFPTAATNLELGKQRYDEYSVLWETKSNVNKKAYLRQNMGLLYANGRLLNTMGAWKQNTMELTEDKTVVERESRLFQAIAFHYAEIHDENDRIFSSQKLSSNHMYVVNSKFDKGAFSFSTPQSEAQKEWKGLLDKETEDVINYHVKDALKHFSVNSEDYPNKILLTDLAAYNDKPFPGFTQAQTATIIGQLTEGLYKNYFLGITKDDGTVTKPIGSTIPVILLAKDHLLVVFTTADNEPVILRQQISAG